MSYVVKTKNDKVPSGESPFYLGTWCLDKPCLADLSDYQLFPYLWSDKEKYNQTGVELEARQAGMFRRLVMLMNQIHGETFSEQYWGVLLSNWFVNYLATFYDRYQTIRELEKLPQDLQISCIDSAHLRVPCGTGDAQKMWMEDDLFNEQLYAQILSENIHTDVPMSRGFSGIEVPKKQDLKDKIILTGLYCAGKDVLALKSGLGSVASLAHFDFDPQNSLASIPLSSQRRIFASAAAEGEDEFERLLFKSFILNLPKFHIEAFSFLRKKVLTDWELCKVFVTNNDHYTNDFAKLAMAEVVRAGGKIIWGQHGSNFFTGYQLINNKSEVAIPSRYFSWGWAEPEEEAIVNVPSLSISGLVGNTAKQEKPNKGPLLFISTCGSKYKRHFISSYDSTDWIHYSQMQVKFIEDLRRDIRDDMIYRPYFQDYGQGILENVVRSNPSILLRTGGNIAQNYDDFRLLVVDHLQSSIGQLLGCNKPSVFYWDKDYHPYNSRTAPTFEAMNKAGIVHYSAKSAAEFVNSVYEEPEKWWFSDEVQESRKLYCNNHAHSSANYIEEWVEQIQVVYNQV